MQTRAVILAAGRGSRMGESTANSHKCLTLLQNKTLLNWQLDALNAAGIKDIIVVRGYKSEMLTGEFKVAENSRWAHTNMVASLFCAPPFKGDTIISYSDIVYKSDHIVSLLNINSDFAITADIAWLKLWKERFENPEEDAETFVSENGRLIEIGGKTKNIQQIQAQYMGLLKFSEIGWQAASKIFNSFSTEKQDKMDMTSFLSELLNRKIEISIALVNGGWCEVDNNNDVITYEKAINAGVKWHHDWR